MLILNGKVAALAVRVFMDTPQSGITLGLQAIELRQQLGGTNLANVPGRASSSSAAWNPGNAVDGNPATNFTPNTNAAWFEYRRDTSANIAVVTLIARNDASFGQAPTQCSIAFQDERGRWPIVKSVIGMTWTQGSSVDITIPIAIGPTRIFNLSQFQSIYSP
jgi:hypothetical protein